jgi:hypothetical protein
MCSLLYILALEKNRKDLDSDLALTDLHGLGVFDRYNEIRMDISVFPGFRRCERRGRKRSGKTGLSYREH